MPKRTPDRLPDPDDIRRGRNQIAGLDLRTLPQAYLDLVLPDLLHEQEERVRLVHKRPRRSR